MLGVFPVDIFINNIFVHLDGYDLVMWQRTCKTAYHLVKKSYLSEEKIQHRVIVCTMGSQIRRHVAGLEGPYDPEVVVYKDSYLSALEKLMYKMYKKKISDDRNKYFFEGDGFGIIYREPYCFIQTDCYCNENHFPNLYALELEFPEIFKVYMFYFPTAKNLCLFDDTHDSVGCCDGHLHRGHVTMLRVYLPDKMMMYERVPPYNSPESRKKAKLKSIKIPSMSENLESWIFKNK